MSIILFILIIEDGIKWNFIKAMIGLTFFAYPFYKNPILYYKYIDPTWLYI